MYIENKNSGFWSFLKYSFYGFFAIFPFFIFKNFLYQGSSSRFLLLSLLICIVGISFGFYVFSQKNRVSLIKTPLFLIFGIYTIFLFISAILGYDFNTSFWSTSERTSGLFYYIHLAFFTLFLSGLVLEIGARKKILQIVIYSSAIYSLFSLMGPQGFGLIFKNVPYDGFLFGNSSFAAMYLFGAFLLSLFYVKTENIKWYEYLLPILIIFNPFLLNVTGPYDGVSDILGISRASSAGLFVSIGLILLIFLISKIKNIRIKKIVSFSAFFLSLIGLVLAITSLINPNGFVRSLYEKEATLARPLVWEISSNAIDQKPITGWGVDNFNSAYQNNFDARLLTEEYGNEPWFDRAHNIVIDQMVDTGYLGTLLYFSLYLVLFVVLLYVLFSPVNSSVKTLSSVLLVYFFVHILELQTAFDTTISAVMFSLMVALSVYAYTEARRENGLNYLLDLGFYKNILSVFFVVLFGWSLFFGVIPFWNVQNVNGEIRSVGSSEKRLPLYEKLFSAKVDRAGVLWRTSTDFQKGIAQDVQILESPEKVKFLVEELGVITKAYEEYVKEHPNHFRSRLNLADVYIYHMLFGIDRLKEADLVLDEAIILGPNHPQPYWMKSVISLYRRDFNSARGYVQKAKEINKNVVETKRLEKYIEESIKTFPEIDLYFFNQI